MATPDVTLVIPCYKGEEFIEHALKSVVAQTLAADRFEVLIVFNGQPDGSERVCDDVFEGAPHILHRYLHLERASASNARNIGVQEARGHWVTWLDVDDWLSPNYLEELLASAQPGIVPLAGVVDVDEATGEQRSSPITEQILAQPPGVHPAHAMTRALGFTACKLVEVASARVHPFDANLTSGEDVAFFAPFFVRFGLSFDTSPAARGATYFRLVRDGSLSRQDPSFDFSVTQRLAVMRHLDESLRSGPSDEMARTIRSLMVSQTLFTQRFVERHPESYGEVVRAYQESGIAHIPWQHLVKTPTTNLLISYNFPPFADASAITAAKRALASGEQWNVVSNSMSGIRRFDPQLVHLTGPVVATHKVVSNPPVFGSWDGVEAFCRDGLAAITEIEVKHGPQDRVYSRAVWPASHFLAAQYVARSRIRPHWTAEFSDPLRRDVLGKDRPSSGVPGPVMAELSALLRAEGFQPPRHETVFSWAEHVAYALADRLLFTNPHQLTYMLSYLEDPRLQERVRERAVVEPHPTLPARYYSLDRSHRLNTAGRCSIGYFGTFYANRAMGDVLRALGTLDPTIRSRLALHLYTPKNAELTRAVRQHGLEGVVIVHEELPYMRMLGALAEFDCLLVSDADTASGGHELNPFLPSKLSDYRGAGTPVWALVEPGSTLSRYAAEYHNRLGDVSGMAVTLERLAKVDA